MHTDKNTVKLVWLILKTTQKYFQIKEEPSLKVSFSNMSLHKNKSKWKNTAENLDQDVNSLAYSQRS